MTDHDHEFPGYPKIPSPWKRSPDTNRFDYNQWISPAVQDLRNADWEWTEKIDGMNIRIGWDGFAVRFGGRSDRADIHKDLRIHLDGKFHEEIMESAFGSTPVVLFGEGYGAGIQKGGHYREDKAFILFDVLINNQWLSRESKEGISTALNIDIVPLVYPLWDNGIWGAVDLVRERPPTFEGVVGTIPSGVLDKHGKRIQVKVKRKDVVDD